MIRIVNENKVSGGVMLTIEDSKEKITMMGVLSKILNRPYVAMIKSNYFNIFVPINAGSKMLTAMCHTNGDSLDYDLWLKIRNLLRVHWR